MIQESKTAFIIGIGIVIICVVIGIIFSNSSLSSYNVDNNTYQETKSDKEKVIEVLEQRGYALDEEYYNVYVKAEKHHDSGLDILAVLEFNFNNKTISHTFIISDNGSIVYGRDSHYSWNNNYRKGNITEYTYQNGNQYVQYSVDAYYDSENHFICNGNSDICNDLSEDIRNLKNEFLEIISEVGVTANSI